jgi:hypothetical protein
VRRKGRTPFSRSFGSKSEALVWAREQEFEADKGLFMFTSKRDYVGNLFLRQFVRIATALRGSLVMDEKHPLHGRVMIHVEEGFKDVDHELHRSFAVI